jgi:hypothetical protein
MTTAMLQKIKSIEFENKSIGYVKPATKYVRGYGKGELRLNKSTMDLLLAMSKYVDSSSRVVININKLAKMQKRTLEEALKQAEFERLL